MNTFQILTALQCCKDKSYQAISWAARVIHWPFALSDPLSGFLGAAGGWPLWSSLFSGLWLVHLMGCTGRSVDKMGEVRVHSPVPFLFPPFPAEVWAVAVFCHMAPLVGSSHRVSFCACRCRGASDFALLLPGCFPCPLLVPTYLLTPLEVVPLLTSLQWNPHFKGAICFLTAPWRKQQPCFNL